MEEFKKPRTPQKGVCVRQTTSHKAGLVGLNGRMAVIYDRFVKVAAWRTLQFHVTKSWSSRVQGEKKVN